MAIVTAFQLTGWLTAFEYRLMDMRFLFSDSLASGEVVVVEIDSRSLTEIGTWPWPRGHHADVLNKLFAAGARHVAYDVDFSSHSIPKEDLKLRQALATSSGNVTLPVFKQFSFANNGSPYLTYTAPIAEFQKHVRLASINVRPEIDGLIRRMPVREDWQERTLPAMATVLADESSVDLNPYYVDIGINLRSIPHISFVDVLHGRFDPTTVVGKKILIGATAVELNDYLTVPLHLALPGVEFQALAAESLIQGRALREMDATLLLFLTVLLALAVWSPLVHWPWRRGLVVVGVAWVGGVIAAYWAHASLALVVGIAPWLMITGLSFLFGIVSEIDQQAVREFISTMAARHRDSALSLVIERNLDGIFVTDAEGVVKEFNPAAAEMFDCQRDEVIGKAPGFLIPTLLKDQPGFFSELATKGSFETVGWRKDGSAFHIELLVTEMALDVTKHKLERRLTPRHHYIFTVRDITDRKRSEGALLESEKKYRSMFRDSGAIKLFIDPVNGHIVESNLAAALFYGYSSEELNNLRLADINELSEQGMAREIAAIMGEKKSYFIEKQRLSSGETRDVEVHSSPIDFNGRTYILLIIHDITERSNAEEHLRHLATHDALTGLSNRSLLMDQLHAALAHAKRAGDFCAVHFLDIDKFKNINDTLGHEIGDLLLREISRRLRACVRQTDTVARYGGDEFAVIQSSFDNEVNAAILASKLNAAIAEPFDLEGHRIFTGASIGVSVFPNDSSEPVKLLQNADMAMYQAKRESGNTFHFFHDELNKLAKERLSLESDLSTALERQEFILYYQPQVCFKTGFVVGMEALLRWNHPVHGLISPVEFIGLAEKSGLIAPLGEWVLRNACAQTKAWQLAGWPELRVSVNVSPVQLTRKELVTTVRNILDETGFEPHLLELEVTETAPLGDCKKTSETLQKISQLGVGLAIDDFGIGHSSLSHLKNFNFDTIKIDMSYVHNIGAGAVKDETTAGIIRMGQTLGMTVIAEGVETEVQYDYLLKKGCDVGQGFHISHLLDVVEVDAFLGEWTNAPLRSETPVEKSLS